MGFGPFFLIFGRLVPATITYPKLVALVRNKQNIYGTQCEAHFILEKLTVKMGNNGHQQLVLMFCRIVLTKLMWIRIKEPTGSASSTIGAEKDFAFKKGRIMRTSP